MTICTNCNGKGYNTVYKGEGGYTDFGPMKYIETLPMGIHKVPCSRCQVKEEVKDNEKEITGQTVYEQLQEMLNKCIELGLMCDILKDTYPDCKINIESVECYDTYIRFNIFLDGDKYNKHNRSISYHELFSRDSGIMEFIEWTDSDTYHNYICMCEKTAEEKVQYFVNNARPPRI